MAEPQTLEEGLIQPGPQLEEESKVATPARVRRRRPVELVLSSSETFMIEEKFDGLHRSIKNNIIGTIVLMFFVIFALYVVPLLPSSCPHTPTCLAGQVVHNTINSTLASFIILSTGDMPPWLSHDGTGFYVRTYAE